MPKFLKDFIQFLKDVREEMKQVTWPGRQDLIGSIMVVFVGMFILAGYIGVVDVIYSEIAKVLLR